MAYAHTVFDLEIFDLVTLSLIKNVASISGSEGWEGGECIQSFFIRSGFVKIPLLLLSEIVAVFELNHISCL